MRLTAAQALLRFLAAQHVERDGVERQFFGGVLGIFGHGNVAGFGEAIYERPELLPFTPARNEQAMVHTASGYARMRNRLGALVCTSSIGPGATNMVTGAALATVNRLPVLLVPGDVFAARRPDPVLQQVEAAWAGDVTVNDCFRPVARYFDRIWRPEQLGPAALAAMRVLTDQAETGAAVLAFPQDVQAEAWDYPEELFRRRVWHVPRALPDEPSLAAAAELIRGAERPLLVAGGGVLYSEASDALRAFCEQTGVPVGETQAGKGSLPYDHPSALGAIGATGTFAANRLAATADVVVGVGTRWTDFTTASRTAFAAAGVRFVNVNVAGFDAAKHAGIPLVGDARATLERLGELLQGWAAPDDHRAEAARLSREWDAEVERLYRLEHGPPAAQSAIIGAVNDATGPTDVLVCAAGSLPGDLHKLWRTRDPKGYHVEYGYSCMGYEVAGGLGVKLAAPEREVVVLVGDGSWLMLSSELVTAVERQVKLTVVLVDSRGYKSIGSLSRSLGTEGFGTQLETPVDLAANAASLGARARTATTPDELRSHLAEARAGSETTVIVVAVDPLEGVPDYESWWDVAVAEVSDAPSVQAARAAYEQARERVRTHL